MPPVRTVLVAGTFDILHPGHLDFFTQARKHGDRIVCIVARDSTVLRIKGKKALHTENARLDEVVKCGLVDKARLGTFGDLLDVVLEEKPDVICLGYDQQMDEKALAERLLARNFRCSVVRLAAHAPHKYKSTIIKAAARQSPRTPTAM